MKGKNLLNTAIVLGILSVLIFPPSCANTSAPPTGGPKDTIPPLLVAITPAMNATMHPRDMKHSQVSFEFDEYVVLNNPNSYIFLSPPQSKPPVAKIKGKRWWFRSRNLWTPAEAIPCLSERLSRTTTKGTLFLHSLSASLPETMWTHCSSQAI